jgi:hypothetical protein
MTKKVPTYGFPNFVKDFIEDDKTYKGYNKEQSNIFSNIKKINSLLPKQPQNEVAIVDLSDL